MTNETLLVRAERAEAACAEAIRILGSGERMALTRAIAVLSDVEQPAPFASDPGEHYRRGYDDGHSRGLTCGRLYKTDDLMRMHRAECVSAYKAELRGEDCDE